MRKSADPKVFLLNLFSPAKGAGGNTHILCGLIDPFLVGELNRLGHKLLIVRVLSYNSSPSLGLHRSVKSVH
jgi:hypothetical protein